MQPGIIYNYLSILKAEQLALIMGKELWVVAGTVEISGLELANTHSNGATMRLRGSKILWLWDRNEVRCHSAGQRLLLFIQDNANYAQNKSTKPKNII